MEYTVLGRTGLRVSRVGCGSGGIGQVWGPTTEAESVRTIHRALELGVTFFAGYNGFCGSCSTPFIEPQTSKFSSQLSA
jgi:predicted aldo/keto reductase-like oxidoreductase